MSRARAGDPSPDLRLVDLPLILCLGMLLRVTLWYVLYAGPLTFDFATGGATARGLPGYAGVLADGEAAQIAGSAGIFLHSVILTLFLVVPLRHLRLPRGSITLIMLYDALLIVPATDQWLALPVVAVAALTGEVIWSRIQHGGLGGIDGDVGYWMLGAGVPLVLSAAYLASLAVFGGGLTWSIHLWAGVPAAAGILGLTTAVLGAPPAFVRLAAPGR